MCYLLIPQVTDWKKIVCASTQKVFGLKYEVSNDIKKLEMGIIYLRTINKNIIHEILCMCISNKKKQIK